MKKILAVLRNLTDYQMNWSILRNMGDTKISR